MDKKRIQIFISFLMMCMISACESKPSPIDQKMSLIRETILASSDEEGWEDVPGDDLMAEDSMEDESLEMEEEMEEEYTEEEYESNAETSTHNTYNYSYTNNEGYEMAVTIEVGEWIKADEINMIQNEWEYFGGTGEVPAMSDFKSNSFNKKQNYYEDTSIVLLGNISFQNLTSGYDATEAHPLNPKMILDIEGANDLPQPIVAFDYGSYGRIYYNLLCHGLAYTNNSPSIIIANMTSNRWGRCLL